MGKFLCGVYVGVSSVMMYGMYMQIKRLSEMVNQAQG